MNGITLKRIQDIQVGDVAYSAKTVTEADVMMFAMLSGDYASHHVDATFAETTVFKTRIAHGMLTAGLICPVLRLLCGDGSVTYSQEIKFKSAVLLNDTVTVKGEVVGLFPDENKVKVDVVCVKQGYVEGDRPLVLGSFVQSLIIQS